MTHPPIADLLDSADKPEVVDHLSECAACRAQARVLEGVTQVDAEAHLPGIEAARARLEDVRRQASLSLSRSLRGDESEDDDDDFDDLRSGRFIDRYEVLERIGRGGMGTVYKVRHVRLGSLHALKVLHRASRSIRSRLVREGQAQSQLRHPNVVAVTDIVDVDGAPGLIMEYVCGPTLHDYLRDNGAPPLDEADRLGRQIIRGVAAAHASGIVHRDLKPANVLLVPTDEGYLPKVTDFGLARQLDSDMTLITRSNAALGTPAYMAPEQIRDSATADERSDIFSLGAVLYELLTGKRAFRGVGMAEVFDKIRSGDYDPFPPEVPPRLADAVIGALQPDPAKRFQSCASLLDLWRGPSFSTLSHVTLPEAPRRSWSPLISLGIGAAVLGSGAFLFWDNAPVAAVQAPTTSHRVTALPDELQIYDIALSEDGETLVYTDGRGAWRQDVHGGLDTQLMPGGQLHSIDFFPGAKEVLVSGWRDGKPGTWVVSAQGGEERLLFPRSGTRVRVSPDGREIAMADTEGIWILPAEGGTPRRIRTLSEQDATSELVWSPSGQSLAAVYHSMAQPPWLEVLAADGSSTRRLLEDKRLIALSMSPLAWTSGGTLLYALAGAYEDKDTQLFALRDAETAKDVRHAEVVHSWNGFWVLRIHPTEDGRRLVYSRATADHGVHVIPLGNTTARRKLDLPDGYIPLGWASATSLWVTAPDANEIYEVPLAGERERVFPQLDDMWTASLRRAGNELVASRANYHTDPAVVELARVTEAGAIPFYRAKFANEGLYGKRVLYQSRCFTDRCLLSEPTDSTLQFVWVDIHTGQRSEPVLETSRTMRFVHWDLTPDERKIVVVTSPPSKIRVHDLETGSVTVLEGALEMPMGVTWAEDGEHFYVSGLSETEDMPYFLYRVSAVDGSKEAVWGSMTRLAHDVYPSPDGSVIAVRANTFDDDVWLMDGLTL